MRNYFLLLLWFVSLGHASCQTRYGNEHSEGSRDEGFPYNKRPSSSYTMPAALEEISGITFLKDIPQVVFAIQDEEGLLFQYDLRGGKLISHASFGDKGDYEEVATDDTYFYVLKSNGDIYSFPIGQQPTPDVTIINTGLIPEGEYESMAYDPTRKSLFVLCKVCKSDKKTKSVSGYILHVGDNGRLSYDGQFSLDIQELSDLHKKIKKTFKPSAMAKRESSGEWYILSSIDQALVITDSSFKPKKVIHLPRKDFEQPEGIAFDPDDNLFISSEAGRTKHGTIYRFNIK